MNNDDMVFQPLIFFQMTAGGINIHLNMNNDDTVEILFSAGHYKDGQGRAGL